MAMLQDTSVASASWMEHQILDHVKQALRVTLDWKAPEVSVPRKISSLKFTMKSFQRHLERVMRTEEEGGYMRVVVDSKPYLCDQIERLENDHTHIRQRMRLILPLVEDLTEWREGQFDEVCGEIRNLLDEIDLHDGAEIELLQESLLSDEGGEG